MIDRKQQMLNLKNKGFSYGQIGKLFNLSRQRVHQLINNYQILLTNNVRRNKWYFRIKQKILKRDDNTCQKCGEATDLIIHHIDNDDNNNEFTNLITLCNKCHLRLHKPHHGVSGSKSPFWKDGRFANNPKKYHKEYDKEYRKKHKK